MIDLFPGGILVASGGAVIRANESFQTMFHLETQSQILTRLMSSPEFAARFQQFEAETQKSRTDFEAAILLPSGKRTFWFLLVKADEMTPEQNEVIVVALDVQAKKDAESQIESQRMKLETNARLATLGEIAGNVAHEINNPLFVISSRAQLMLLKMEKGSENEKMLRTHLDAILATCDRVVKIVRGLKSVSRNSENEAFERTSLKTVIDQTIDLCSSRISQTGAKIEVDDISQHLQVEIRPVQLSQVFLNLLNNAFDAIEGSESPWIKVGVHFSKTEFEVSVMDSGEGFPKELRHRMMDPFFSTKAPGKGTGLGLSISLRIVKAHQGELFLDESSPHTKFVARLPLEQKCLVGQAL
jgi:C4-dicarboxylate-specific signal transduction histidine kinase